MLVDMPVRSAVISALVCLAVTGCAGALPTQTVTHPIPAPSQTQLTGTALKSALLALSDFPSGYEIDTQETVDTGPTLLPGGSTSRASTSQNCQQLAQALQLPSAGLTGGVFEILYDATMNHLSSYHQRRYGQSVFQFATTSASTAYFDSVRFTFSRCSSVTAKDGDTTTAMKQTVNSVSIVAGHEALLVRQTGTVNRVNVDSIQLFTIAGTDVYVVGATVFGVPLTVQPSALAALAAKLIARVHSFECALACTSQAAAG